jgi:hypothetical protein
MKNAATTIRAFLKRHGHLDGAALETATREWTETNTTWAVFTRSVRAGLVYPGADNYILCPKMTGQRS